MNPSTIPVRYGSPSSTDWTRWWPAPAKLNLFLHVLGQRSDGYHELETVFQLIDLHDNVQFTARTDGLVVRAEGESEIPQKLDIVVHAGSLLQEHLERTQPQNKNSKAGVTIRYRKRIPMQAGLGGGSSDAATCLLVLNHLWEAGLSEAELLDLATQMGADVPVFIQGQSAYARGIGEILEPIDIPQCWFLIVKPQASVSTQKIFNHHGLTRASEPITIHGFLEALSDWPAHLVGQNDCQKVVEQEFTEISQVIDWLSNFGDARLTGTGACVFLPCQDQISAKAVLDQLSLTKQAHNWQMMIVKGINQSPLHTLLNTRKG